MLAGKTVNILGAGRSGKAAALLAASKGASVTVYDTAAEDKFPEMPEGINCFPSATMETGKAAHCDLLVISPGIDTFGEYVAAFSENAGEMIGETELGSRYYNGKVVGITGTNGKTTTTELVQRILSKSGISCVSCGNYGVPLSEVVMMDEVPDSIALELSSFQLETIRELKPDVAIWLNFDADHMDRYQRIEDYKNAKLRIFMNQTRNDIALVKVGEDVGEISAKRLTFSTETDSGDFRFVDGWIVFGEEKIIDLEQTRLRGLHNAENAMAAIGACMKLGISPQDVAASLAGFAPPKHRCELIRTLDGVEYLNDSKATNLHALDSALRSQSRPIILIAGGKEKGLNYSALVPRLRNCVKYAVVFGEISSQLESVFSQATDTESVENLEQAIVKAKSKAQHGDVILFSPGTSSFDQFTGYEHRGDVFREIVLNLK